LREITAKEIAELERRHNKNVEELAGHLSRKTGIHEGHIKGKLHELIESIPLEKRLAVKMHMARLGVPALAVAMLELPTHGGVSMGTVSPELLLVTAVVGGMAGWIISKRYEHRLKEITREHAERVKQQVGKVI
jgi:hypothetical protein